MTTTHRHRDDRVLALDVVDVHRRRLSYAIFEPSRRLLDSGIRKFSDPARAATLVQSLLQRFAPPLLSCDVGDIRGTIGLM
jgi:hypothetical protein